VIVNRSRTGTMVVYIGEGIFFNTLPDVNYYGDTNAKVNGHGGAGGR